MIYGKIDDMRMNNGALPAYTGVGSYPIFYVTEADTVVCAGCLNDNESFLEDDDPEFNVRDCDVNWEDDNLICEYCEENIEAAYGV